ncbi:MAG: hypothetical protein PHP25_04325, partial [Candidatus Moranbacteria bacterium]|nr:hypothetical protein [Candidatus Moranbacteria bacterium]
MNFGFAKEFTEIKKELERSSNVLIVAHAAPDGDTIGSSFALKEYLVADLGKKTTVICPDALPQYLKDFLG